MNKKEVMHLIARINNKVNYDHNCNGFNGINIVKQLVKVCNINFPKDYYISEIPLVNQEQIIIEFITKDGIYCFAIGLGWKNKDFFAELSQIASCKSRKFNGKIQLKNVKYFDNEKVLSLDYFA